MLGERLKVLRGKRTQQEIADKLSISRARYSHYENDHVQPDNDLLQKMATLYNCSVDYLLGRTNERLRTLQPHSQKMIDLLDQNLSNEEIYNAFKEQFLVGGIPMTKEEALFFISYIRTKRSMEKEQGREHSDSDSVSTP